MPGWDDSNSPLSCSSVFICGLPTIATVTVPVACCAPAGLAAVAAAAGWAAVGAPAGALVAAGCAAGALVAAAGAAGALVAGACPACPHAAMRRLRKATNEVAGDHQWVGRDEADRGELIPAAPYRLP